MKYIYHFITDLSWNSSPEYSSQLLAQALRILRTNSFTTSTKKWTLDLPSPTRYQNSVFSHDFLCFWVSLMSYQSFQQAQLLKSLLKNPSPFFPKSDSLDILRFHILYSTWVHLFLSICPALPLYKAVTSTSQHSIRPLTGFLQSLLDCL